MAASMLRFVTVRTFILIIGIVTYSTRGMSLELLVGSRY
jgi:hypothetical protein